MPSLKVNPQRAQDLIQNISTIRTRISKVTQTHSLSAPRLVAVSKLKPATDILALHKPTGTSFEAQVHFGENYVQELVEKSRLLPSTIKWHFIGGLQSNKCKSLARDVRGLWAVESVDSVKKAKELDKGWSDRKAGKGKSQSDGEDDAPEQIDGEEGDGTEEKLRVFVQINTSGEESKSGVEPESNDLEELCTLISKDCQNLRLQGLMTIGAIARSQATTAGNENEDFAKLREVKKWLEEKGYDGLELSMGMSEDFEGAIAQGSNEVRVGSTIFGERPKKSEAKVLENTEESKS